MPFMGTLTAAHQDLIVVPVFAQQCKTGIGPTTGTVGLVGHRLGMHEQIKVTAQGPQTDGPADDEKGRIEQLSLRIGAAKSLQRADQPDGAQQRQQHMRMARQKLAFVPFAKSGTSNSLGQTVVQRVSVPGVHGGRSYFGAIIALCRQPAGLGRHHP